ncbi:hypothetical protein KDL45_15105, partial [bacterium]|nr:hypothetical protein [bacterium]
EQYRRLRSDEDLRTDGGVSRSHHANALLSFIRSGRLAERLFEHTPTLACGEPSTDGTPWRRTPEFALNRFALEPGGRLQIDAEWSRDLWGYPAQVEGRVPDARAATLAFPYPVIDVRFRSVDSSTPNVRLRDPELLKDRSVGSHFDLAGDHLRQTRVFQAIVENLGGGPLEYVADARVAKAAVPELEEGANRFRFDGHPVDPGAPAGEVNIVVRLVVETRINRSLDRGLDRYRRRHTTPGAP